MKDILVALITDGYTPRCYAGHEPDGDSLSLAGPPPTLAEQYVNGMRERHFEMDALFGTADIPFEVQHWASNVHPAYTDAMNVLRGDGYIVFEDGSYVLDTEEIDLFQLQPKMLTSEERADLEAYYQDPPSEFTIPWHSVEGHDMALHRRNYDVPQGAMFHISCSCGWQSEPSTLEIDAYARGTLHTKEVRQQKDRHPVLRFRDHMLSSSRLRNPRILHQNEDRWVGLCACGWSYIERTEEDAEDDFEKHWTALIDDPAMYADYVAFREEEGLPSPRQTNPIVGASEN